MTDSDGRHTPVQIKEEIDDDEPNLMSLEKMDRVSPEMWPQKGGPTPATEESSMIQCLDYLKKLIGMQQQTNTRILQLERRMAHQSTQIELILDAIGSRGSVRTMPTEPEQMFSFAPINDAQRLLDLEENLDDELFKTDFMRWLRFNVSGDCAENRMICALDLVLSKQFQTQCTWTGSSRKGPKIPMMMNRRILQVFQEIGSSETEIVTHQKLASFFMKKLKNALKRLASTGQRRSTRHVVKKSRKRKIIISDDSGKLNGNASQGSTAVSNEIDESHLRDLHNETEHQQFIQVTE